MQLSQLLLESALLTEATDEQIAEVFGYSSEKIKEERERFKPSSFSRLEKLDYVTGIEDKTEKLYKLWAISNGLPFIQWKLGIIPTLDPVAALQQLFTDCLMKSRESIFLSNTSEESREAVKWTALSIQLGKLLKSWVLDSNQATLDLQLALSGSVLADFPSRDDL